MKKSLFISIFALAASPMFAGGLLTNTNQSAHFLRNPALDATTEIDGVYANPAGLVFLSDGFHLSVSNQSVTQTRTITSNFAPFAANNGGDPIKSYLGTAEAPLVPSFQLAYKKDRYVISAGFAITGGGGKATFANGLPSFEAPVSMIPLSLTSNKINTTSYSVESFMEGKQFIYGFQLNGSYKITDALSAAVGVRINILNSGYVGYLRNIQINPSHPSLNPTAATMKANTFFTNAATSAQATSTLLNPIVSAYGTTTMSKLVTDGVISAAMLTQLSTGLGTNVSAYQASQVQAMYNGAAAVYTTNANATADKQLDTEQSGIGFTPILSLDYHISGLNLAAKYEFKSSINIKNTTAIDQTGLYPDGATTPSDIPALLSLGAEYQVCSSWKVSGGYHHFFDSDAKMANDKQQYINGGINEYLLGTEYAINSKFLLSAGGQITRTGVTDAYQSDLSYSLNSYSIGFGGAVNLTPQLRLNLSYFFTNYTPWTKESTNYNNTTLAGSDIFDRTNKVFGIGLDYKF